MFRSEIKYIELKRIFVGKFKSDTKLMTSTTVASLQLHKYKSFGHLPNDRPDIKYQRDRQDHAISLAVATNRCLAKCLLIHYSKESSWRGVIVYEQNLIRWFHSSYILYLRRPCAKIIAKDAHTPVTSRYLYPKATNSSLGASQAYLRNGIIPALLFQNFPGKTEVGRITRRSFEFFTILAWSTEVFSHVTPDGSCHWPGGIL